VSLRCAVADVANTTITAARRAKCFMPRDEV
jgi:hypothetical protein